MFVVVPRRDNQYGGAYIIVLEINCQVVVVAGNGKLFITVGCKTLTSLYSLLKPISPATSTNSISNCLVELREARCVVFTACWVSNTNVVRDCPYCRAVPICNQYYRLLLSREGRFMKRVLTIVGVVLAVIVTICVLVFVLFYTGVLKKEDVDGESVHVYEDDAGHVYTERVWDWKPIESKRIISYHDSVSTPTKIVTLMLSDNTFYDVTIPDVPYMFDFGRTLWASDGSFMIRVVGDVNISNLSSIAGIDNGENINQFTLRNKDGVKGQRVIATLIDDVAVVVNVYQGDDTFTILHNSIANNREAYTVEDVTYAKSCKTLNALEYSGKYTPSIAVDGVSLYQTKHLFEDGSLWYQGVTKSFSDVCKEYMVKLCAFSITGKIEEVYNNGDVLYAKSGSYHLAVISYNANTCLVIVGDGEEALCNILSNILQLK